MCRVRINLPVMSNEERAKIGTIYVQQSPFLARKLGAAIVARNAARISRRSWLTKRVAGNRLVYCWRGGQRSGSFASILSQIGWRTDVLEGGYRSLSHTSRRMLYEMPCRIVCAA